MFQVAARAAGRVRVAARHVGSSVRYMSSVRSLESSKEWKEFMDQGEGSNAKSVYWTAAWCGPCKQISPEYERLSAEFTDIQFVKVDVDECEEAAQTAGIKSMPTFQFYKFGAFLGEFSGASPDDLKQYLTRVDSITEGEYKLAVAAQAEANAKSDSASNGKEFGQKFLAENANNEGVVTLASGLQYKVLRAGEGTEHPLAGSSCKCHYEGRTAQSYPDGKTFDSSYARGDPTSFAPNQVISGWTEAMQLMVEGDKWEMYIPSDLGYGDRGAGGDIGPGDTLVFTMEIIEINGPTRPRDE